MNQWRPWAVCVLGTSTDRRHLGEMNGMVSVLSANGYHTRITRDPADVEAAQRLRHQVFSAEVGAELPTAMLGMDVDPFDAFCEHLVVRHEPSNTVVGTCRLLRPESAVWAGGLYSEGLFDLSRHRDLRPSLLEVGRSCVHPDHRNGSVIASMWSGIVAHAEQSGCSWLGGCCSTPLVDGGALAAGVWAAVSQRYLAPQEYRVRPHRPWRPAGQAPPARTVLPALLRGYLRLGSWVCGEQAHDPDFRTADLYVLLDLDRADHRYLDRFRSLRAA